MANDVERAADEATVLDQMLVDTFGHFPIEPITVVQSIPQMRKRWLVHGASCYDDPQILTGAVVHGLRLLKINVGLELAGGIVMYNRVYFPIFGQTLPDARNFLVDL